MRTLFCIVFLALITGCSRSEADVTLVASPSPVADATPDLSRCDRLDVLRERLRLLISKYTVKHPMVVKLESEIRTLELACQSSMSRHGLVPHKDWRPREFNGVTYYVVPLDGSSID